MLRIALTSGLEAPLSRVWSVFTNKRANGGTDRVTVEIPVSNSSYLKFRVGTRNFKVCRFEFGEGPEGEISVFRSYF